MAKFAHITPINASSSKLSAPAAADELLDAYSSWLFFERHFLHIGRFGVDRALGLVDAVQVDNAGAIFHLPLDSDLPDYAAPARRAALVLSAIGLKVRGSTRAAR
jgi:hypothetical protein